MAPTTPPLSRDARLRFATTFWVGRACSRAVGDDAPEDVLNLVWRFMDQASGDRALLAAARTALRERIARHESEEHGSALSRSLPVLNAREQASVARDLACLQQVAELVDEISELAEDLTWLEGCRVPLLRLCGFCLALNDAGKLPSPEVLRSAAELVLEDQPRSNVSFVDLALRTGQDPHMAGRMG